MDNQFTFFDFDFFGTGYLAYDIGVFMWYDHKNKTPEITLPEAIQVAALRPIQRMLELSVNQVQTCSGE